MGWNDHTAAILGKSHPSDWARSSTEGEIGPLTTARASDTGTDTEQPLSYRYIRTVNMSSF